MNTKTKSSDEREAYRRLCAPLCWSYNQDALDPDRDARIFIMTVLRIGSWDQVKATFAYYGRPKIREVFLNDFYGNRELPVPVRVLWGNFFVPGEPIPELVDPRERWRPTRNQAFNM